jgi:starch synthase
MEGISKKDVAVVETPDYLNVNKLAIQYSDGVIFSSASVNKDVENSVINSGKPYLPFIDNETYIDEYSNFYEKILASQNE